MTNQPESEQIGVDGHTIYIVDDDAELRQSLATLLRTLGHAVELYATADAFLSDTAERREGCLLLDVRMPGLSGIQAQRRLIEANSELPIIFMTGHADVPMAVEAMRAGAADFLQKPFREQTLLDALHDALSRNEAGRQRRAETLAAHAAYQTLSPTEQRVMAAVAAGLMNKQIAGEIGRGEHMVKLHRAKIMQKMKVRTPAELVRLAVRLGLD